MCVAPGKKERGERGRTSERFENHHVDLLKRTSMETI